MTPLDRRPTILHLCEHFGGKSAGLHGVAKLFQWWLPGYDADRFRVLVCSRKGRDRAARLFEESGMQPLYLGGGKVDPRNLPRLLRLLRREQVDLIHAHGYGACTWARLAQRRTGIPVLVHEHCNYGSVPLYQRPVERFFGPSTLHCFAVSQSTRTFCLQQRFMPPDRVEVLYTGLPRGNRPQPDPDASARVRSDLGAGPEDLVAGIVSRLESHKGHLDALAALDQVRDSLPHLHLWIVGDGAYEAEIRAAIEERDLGDRVRMTGFRSDIPAILGAVDLQVFPSHMEGTPTAMLEAMAFGQAIVATTADGQGEILEDGRTALLCAPGDRDRLAAHLRCLGEDTQLRARLAREAEVRARDFEGERSIRRMEEVYAAVLAGDRGPFPGGPYASASGEAASLP